MRDTSVTSAGVRNPSLAGAQLLKAQTEAAMLPQNSEEMQAAIVQWVRSTVPTVSAERLMDDVPGCERFLRARSVDSIPPPVVFGIIGVAKIDNLLNLWFKEHRPKWLRNEDAESEHMLRDLTRVRPPKGMVPKPQR